MQKVIEIPVSVKKGKVIISYTKPIWNPGYIYNRKNNFKISYYNGYK